MNSICILDCTLRDGGYCNQWKFGMDNMKKMVNSLVEANVNIVECGFLSNRAIYDADSSRFTSIMAVESILPPVRKDTMFVVMINYGEYEIDDLPDCCSTSIQGIRVAFHKNESEEAIKYCKAIKEKGYKVFVQAMVSLCYSDEEFLELIHRVNRLSPYAFYIVDSFGMMKNKNLMRLFYMVEHNLDENIWIGFHSHNNLQLSYSNAQSLVDAQTRRNLIIDSSIYGMGRGAGNLNTELFINYLNENIGTNYILQPILNIIDEVLTGFYEQNNWGYSLPNYLSASHTIHPNYAEYLSNKKTLTVEAMDSIFSMVDSEKSVEYDEQYIEDLYIRYMTLGKRKSEYFDEFRDALRGKKILLIAPGRNASKEKEKIIRFMKENDALSIGINFIYPFAKTDYVFVSNLRRYRELDIHACEKIIATSNIPSENAYINVKYYDLLNSVEAVRDNAGMMAVKLLIELGIKEAYIAGMDGYSHDAWMNYGVKDMIMVDKADNLDKKNEGIGKVLREYGEYINLHFVTRSMFEDLRRYAAGGTDDSLEQTV